MAYTEVSTTLGALAANISTILSGASGNVIGIRTVASRTGFVRVYDPTLGGTASSNATNLPQITSASQILAHTQYDDAAPWYSQGGGVTNGGAPGALDQGSPRQGMIEVYPAVPAVDAVDAPSVQTFKQDAGTVIVYATN